ncbi:MAG: SET domain-containing protein-lysine N-methyltransferase [Gemmatimonadaceae bacterium]
MKICVLQVDYSTSQVEYRHYDPPRNLAPFAPGHQVDHVFLHKLSTYRQLKELSVQGYDIFVNLCEGYLEWDVPSIDVIHTLEMLNLPYTGPTPEIFDVPKPLMKYVAYSVGVATPRHMVVQRGDDPVRAAGRTALRYPLFVKPVKAGDSLGVDERSLVADAVALEAKVVATLPEYPELLVEEYIEGREFTVLVVGDPEGQGRGRALTPVEYRFPKGHAFKSYALKTSELHPEANVRVADPGLRDRLMRAAESVFRGFDATGYARMDFRMDAAGELHFLEVNFSCSVFYTDGWDGSADAILLLDGLGHAGFLERIIAEGKARHARRQRAYRLRGDTISGYGIVATRALNAGDVVFRGEGQSHRIITRRFAEEHWQPEELELLRRYAYPLSDEIYAYWAADPAEWAPQNHSCNPNTVFDGLDVVALRPIAIGEELTLDYAGFLDTTHEPFQCRCGAPNCRGQVMGTPESSVTAREQSGAETVA